MAKTRIAPPGAPISQEKYLSSPEFAELRGISGQAVTAKSALMLHPAKRSLLFFLQAMSLREGGLKAFSRAFIAANLPRVGTPTMHQMDLKPGRVYDGELAAKILSEAKKPFAWRDVDSDPPSKSGQELIDYCHAQLLKQLPGFLVEFCINPKLYFAAPGENEALIISERSVIEDCLRDNDDDEQANRPINNYPWRPAKNRHCDQPTYRDASLPWFRDIVPALFEFEAAHAAAVRANFVKTSIGEEVFACLDAGLHHGKLVVLEGNSRIGKTTAAQAWCEMHLGLARFISLSGITHKTGLFRALAKALGIGSTYARSSTELQSRIEDLLHRSKLMIVIDEAQHLFSAGERVYSRPELIDWLNTSLINAGVPVALLCTQQFALRMARAEKQTTWNSDQFRGRVKRFHQLPERPNEADLRAVAEKLLPDACANTIKLLVGYGLASKSLPFPALIDAIDEARLIAQREGSAKITIKIVQRAILDYCSVSARAMSRSFDAVLPHKRPGRKPMGNSEPEKNSPEREMEALPAQINRRELSLPESQPRNNAQSLTPA